MWRSPTKLEFVDGSSTDRTRTVAAWSGRLRLSACRSLGALVRLADHPVDALTIRLLGLQRQPELLAPPPGQEAAHRMRLPAGRLHDGRDGRATRPAQQRQHRPLLGPVA